MTGFYDVAFGTRRVSITASWRAVDYDIVKTEVVFDSALFDPPVTRSFLPSKSTVLKTSPSPGHHAGLCGYRWKERSCIRRAQIRAKASFVTSPAASEGYVVAYEHRLS